MDRVKNRIEFKEWDGISPEAIEQQALSAPVLLPECRSVVAPAVSRLLFLAILACVSMLPAQTTPLSFRPLAAQYSSAVDRIVMISTSPDVLHIYDPKTNSDTTVALSSTAISLSVSPDGLHAAVGGSAAVYYIDLQSASIQTTYPGGIGSGSVLLSNSALYIMPEIQGGSYSTTTISYVDLSMGQIVTLGSAYSFTAKNSGVNPVNGQIYQAVLSSPPLLYRITVEGSNLRQKQWSYFSSHSAFGSVWFSPDGTRIYTGNGAVTKSSTDPSADMTYLTSVPTSIQSLTESARRSQVAYISQVPQSPSTAEKLNDTQLRLLSSQYLTPIGAFGLTPFHAGNQDYAAHGRWVFFSADGANLYVLNQADTSAGLINDFALQTIPMDNPTSCAATIDRASIHDGGEGALYTVNLTAGTACTFSATADQSWIAPVSGAFGSGNTPLVFEVRRNNTGQSRTGSINIGGQIISIAQDAHSFDSSFAPLSFNVVAGEYDKILDRFILLSAAPNELHVFDPTTGAEQLIPLGPTPLSLSISADGTHAAVGHDGWLSYVDLANGQVSAIYVLQDVANIVALGSNGYAYTFQRALSGSATSLNLASGIAAQVSLIDSTYAARVGPSGHSLYVDQGGLAAYNLQSSAIIGARASPYLLDNNACAGIWFTEDGARLLSGCGKIFTVSDTAAQDLKPAGSAPLALGGFAWANDSQAAGTIAVIPGNPYQNSGYGVQDTTVQLYSRNDLTFLSQRPLPAFSVGGRSYTGHGHSLSWNSSGSMVFVLEQADSTANLASSYAITSFANPVGTSSCTYSTDASAISVSSDALSMAIPGRSTNCSWTFTTDVSWITTEIGSNVQASAGQAIRISLPSNQTAASRTGHIVIGNKSIAVTQNQAGCTLQVNLTSDFSLYADSVTQGIPFTTGDNCAWSVTSPVSWVTFNSPTAGTGSGVASITVAQNTTGSNRSANLLIGGRSVLIFQLNTPKPGKGTGFGFVPMTPCRVVDTRYPDGPFGGPIIGSHTSRDFTIPLSPCGIPASAQAYAMNVTVVPSEPLSYLTVSPSGGERPVVSTLNSPDGRIKANAAIVAAGEAGSINVYATDDTHVVIDITGYFTETASSALSFVPVAPCRVMDTRNSEGPLGGPVVPGNSTRDLPISQSNCHLGNSGFRASAYSLNFTVIPRGPLSFLTAWPSGQDRPVVSTLNAPTGSVVANAALLQGNYGGSISAFSTQDTDLVIDTNGFFTSPIYAGLRFYPMTPCRALDTRTSSGPLTGTNTYDVATACGVPTAAQAIVFNATAVPDGPLSYLSLWPGDQAKPVVSTLNAQDGMTTSNMAIVPLHSAQINAFSAGTTDLILDVFGYFAP